jgi:hypothetical protein
MADFCTVTPAFRLDMRVSTTDTANSNDDIVDMKNDMSVYASDITDSTDDMSDLCSDMVDFAGDIVVSHTDIVDFCVYMAGFYAPPWLPNAALIGSGSAFDFNR